MLNNRGTKQAIVPGWNEYVKEHHDAAMDAYWLWREMGKPRNGDVFTLMKLCRSRFKYALRKCKREKETIVSDRIADKMCQTDQRNFWKEIRCTMNSNVKLPTCIDGVHGDSNIAALWKNHYSTIFDSVPNSCCAKAHADICCKTLLCLQITANTSVRYLHFPPCNYETKGYRKINILTKTTVSSMFDWKNVTTQRKNRQHSDL